MKDKDLEEQLKKSYKPFKSPRYKYSYQQYQKKVTDSMGTKYFISCALYEDKGVIHFEFDTQFSKNDRSINIKTVSWTSDPEEKRRPYPTLEEVEDMFERMWIAYGSEYYEKSEKMF